MTGESVDPSVRVKLGARSYDVRIGPGSIDRLPLYLQESPSKRAFVITDQRLKLHRARVMSALKKAGWDAHELAVEAGEPLKDIESLYPVYGEMLKRRMDRSSTLIALGGGSVGDAAGFVASTYLRGIRWVGLPTTLLGQVDSSVGGKTAVNHTLGKNLIGTFHQPCLVVCETGFLKTLSDREVISGIGEVAKYGITYDPKFFRYVRANWRAALRLDETVLTRMIKVSVNWKAKAVAQDEFDRTGKREVLNFGHTFGHAIESVTGYGKFQHGEAVIWGMRFATALSKLRRHLDSAQYSEVQEFLNELPVPPLPKRVSPEKYFVPMAKDKKAHEGKVRFVLLSALGKTVSDREVTQQNLMSAFAMITKEEPHGRK